MRRQPFLLAGAMCAAILITGMRQSDAQELRVQTITEFEKIFSGRSDPESRKSFRGALVLHWDKKRFRGFSGLDIATDGRLTAISDHGVWLQLSLTVRDGHLVGAQHPVLKRLHGPDGKKLKGKYKDAEAIAADGHGGFVIAFERRPRLLHYPPWRKAFSQPPTEIALPAELTSLPPNNGIEALTRLCDGRLLILAQMPPPDGPDAWVGGTTGWTGRSYVRSDSFIPTGATTLPDCSIAVLERRGSGKKGHALRIQHLPVSMLGKARTGQIEPTPVFGPVLSPALQFEGITTFGGSRSAPLFYLISDSRLTTGTTIASFSVRIPTTKPGPLR